MLGGVPPCARDRNEFATPLYDTDLDDDSKYGGNRVRQMQAVKDATSSCKSQGLGCTATIDLIGIASTLVIGGINALLGKDD